MCSLFWYPSSKKSHGFAKIRRVKDKYSKIINGLLCQRANMEGYPRLKDKFG